MKRFFVVAAIVAVLVAITLPVIAQTPVGQPQEKDAYTVQQGDTLWALEDGFSGKPVQWQRLVKLNSFLKNPGRAWRDEKGRTIILVRPGEKLQGLVELGILPKLVPLSILKVADPSAPATESSASMATWWQILLLLLALVLSIFLVAYRSMKRNPITTGPAIVEGGITDQTAADRFRESATVGTTGTVQIKDVVRGRLYGAVRVQYRDNSSRHMLLAGEVGYRAMVRRDNDPWTEEYMLQGCGNDIRFSGMRYVPGFGFRFVPEDVIAEASQSVTESAAATAENTATVSAAPPETLQPAAQATEAASTAAPAATTEGDEKGEKGFAFKPATKGRPNLVEMKGFEFFEVGVKDGQTTVRFG